MAANTALVARWHAGVVSKVKTKSNTVVVGINFETDGAYEVVHAPDHG